MMQENGLGAAALTCRSAEERAIKFSGCGDPASHSQVSQQAIISCEEVPQSIECTPLIELQ